MIALKRVAPGEKNALWNAFQEYCREMSALYALDMDDDGRYRYPWFDAYFTDPDREAWWILDDGNRAGFAMINAWSCTGEPIDHAMAEFTVFPRFRNRGTAREAVRQIFATHPGRWEIKFNVENAAGMTLWTHATRPCAPRTADLGDGERALLFSIR